jgi:serine/threonine protein kinase
LQNFRLWNLEDEQYVKSAFTHQSFLINDAGDAYQEDDRATQMQGTIYWMAPEVVHNTAGEGYSAKVDIWGLGCVWQEMCTGVRPWVGENMFQVLLQVSLGSRGVQHDLTSWPSSEN